VVSHISHRTVGWWRRQPSDVIGRINQSFRGAGSPQHSLSSFFNTTKHPLYTPFTRPRPFKFPMACPFDQASDRHSTPSTSSSSSHESSSLSFPASPTGISSHLPTDIGNLHLACPDSQPLEHSDPVIKLGSMAERDQRVEDDAIMLDDWEEEGNREERDHDSTLNSHPDLVSFPFQLDSSTRSSESTACSRCSAHSQQSSQEFNSITSTDVIDVTKLARQDQPPPAYGNVDERSSSLAPRASRPLPRPPIDRLNSSSSIHSTSLVTDAVPSGPRESANPAPQSPSPHCIDSMLSSNQPLPSAAGTSQPPALSVGLSPFDPSSQDRLDRGSAGISPLSSQNLYNTFSPRMASEPSQQLVPSSSFDHGPLWTPNQSFPGAQQETFAASVSSGPISSSGSIQTLPPPPPYSPSEASSSRTGHPLPENTSDMRSMHRPHPALPSSSSRGLPPPAPPTILDPPPERLNSFRRSRAPYEPYLSDAPAPPDSWIAVETSPVEYRLVARLPGFGRDSITLAARRRRVLHVVADSWEPGGGHFERRISFGYDADLSHVRAEFDGEILRVIVPRRTPLLTWYGEACE